MADSHEMQTLQDLEKTIVETEHLFRSSDARLYTPNIDNIENCTNKFIDCYLLEMNVLLHEENVTFRNKMKIKKTLDQYTKYNCLERYPCEVQELTNSTVFFQRMKTFLTKLKILCKGKLHVYTCD